VSALVIVAAALAVLPVLNLWGVIHWTWTAALAPAWGGFLIVGWSYVAGWLLNDIGFIVLLPLIATVDRVRRRHVRGTPGTRTRP
jgi:hypothetical protein